MALNCDLEKIFVTGQFMMAPQSLLLISECLVEPVRPVTSTLLAHSEDFLELYLFFSFLNCLFESPPFSKSQLYCHRNIFPYATICSWAEELVSLGTVFLQQVHPLHVSNAVFLAYERNQYWVVRLPDMTAKLRDMCLHTCRECRETAAAEGS